MAISFKQFVTFIDRTEGDPSEDQIEEAWADIFRKKKQDASDKEDNDSKFKVLTAKERIKKAAEDKKKKEEEHKKELQKKRDKAWMDAKDRASGDKKDSKYDRDDYVFHRQIGEGTKHQYAQEGYWEVDAKRQGYKIRKLTGEKNDHDQTWGAFDGDAKVGEFEEKSSKGWLIREAKDMAYAKNKQPGFFSMGDTEKILKMELGAAQAYLVKKIESTTGASEENARKARAMISKANSVKKLAIDVSNFVLAHETGKNRVIR